MNAFTIGFLASGAIQQVLYCGADAGAAKAALEQGAPGLKRAELYLNPVPTKRWFYPNADEAAEAIEGEMTEGETIHFDLTPEFLKQVEADGQELEALRAEKLDWLTGIQERDAAIKELEDGISGRERSIAEIRVNLEAVKTERADFETELGKVKAERDELMAEFAKIGSLEPVEKGAVGTGTGAASETGAATENKNSPDASEAPKAQAGLPLGDLKKGKRAESSGS